MGVVGKKILNSGLPSESTATTGLLKLAVTRPPVSIHKQENYVRVSAGFMYCFRENGVWKFLMDADTGEGASEENFNKASVLQQ